MGEARQEATPRTAKVLNEAPWRRMSREGAESPSKSRKAVTEAEAEAVSDAALLAAEAPAETTEVAEVAEEPSKPDEKPSTLRHSIAGEGCPAKRRTSFATRSSIAGFTPPNCFAEWLDSRPAMLRLGTAAGMGWEFPLSRTEKRELLVLNLAAENRVQSEQLQIQNEFIAELEDEIDPV